MSRAYCVVSAILLLVLLAGCGLTSPPVGPSSPLATALPPVTTLLLTPTFLPTNTPLPSSTPTPKPTATWVPTLLPASPPPAATPSADLSATMDTIETEVEKLRGLDEISPITRTLMTRQELVTYLEQQFAEEYPPEEVEADVRVLAAFDFVPEDFDLEGLLLTMYSSQILGMYDDEQDTFYVIIEGVEDEFNWLDRVTFAHEYTHGLQDEHFGLDTFMDEDHLNDDEFLARQALVEGDASLAMTQYLMAHLFELTAEDLAALQEETVEADQAVLDAVPPILCETLEFPYTYGLEFVTTLQEKGWEAVDAAFTNPPQSTEQILHPERYFSHDEPQIVVLPPLTDTLGANWHLVEAETLGEFQTNLYLAQQVEQATADLASEGWDGDQYALYVKDDAAVLVFATVWDSPTDREEFVAAYTQYAQDKYGQSATCTGGSETWWKAPTQTACLVWEETSALAILGPDPATVADVLAAVKP